MAADIIMSTLNVQISFQNFSISTASTGKERLCLGLCPNTYWLKTTIALLCSQIQWVGNLDRAWRRCRFSVQHLGPQLGRTEGWVMAESCNHLETSSSLIISVAWAAMTQRLDLLTGTPTGVLASLQYGGLRVIRFATCQLKYFNKQGERCIAFQDPSWSSHSVNSSTAYWQKQSQSGPYSRGEEWDSTYSWRSNKVTLSKSTQDKLVLLHPSLEN